VSPDGLGAFVYRAAPGYVAWSAEGLGLSWDYGADGVDPSADVSVRVYAIEMVHVPEAPFSLGTGGSESNAFRDGGSAAPFAVAGPEAIEVGSAAGQLTWTPSALPLAHRHGTTWAPLSMVLTRPCCRTCPCATPGGPTWLPTPTGRGCA
jgi:hypothetical protein